MSFNGFEKFKLNALLLEKLSQRKITDPTAIQNEVIPKIIQGTDVIGQSMTGTGKTVAYLLPLINSLLNNQDAKTLIIAPTKELAVQIYQEAMFYCESLAITPVLLIPGKELEKQGDLLKQEQQLVIGVPGRIIKAVETGIYKVSLVKKIVLDEADFLIDLGFMKELEKIFGIIKGLEQLLIFSATLSPKTKEMIDLAHNQKSAARIDPKNTLPKQIKNWFIPIKDDNDREKTLLKLLSFINPYLSIIFVRTKEESEHLYGVLKEKKYSVGLLNGNLQAGQRKKIINEFKTAKLQYLVATDLASRGLDIEGITHIINFTQPYNELDYIHRAGRTGRMNEDGCVISICNELDEGYLKKYTHTIQVSLTPYKLTKNGLEEDSSYKGVKPRFNINELKKMDKLEKSAKKEKDDGKKKGRNTKKR